MTQLSLNEFFGVKSHIGFEDTISENELLDYDHYIIYTSGGKDSLACILDLLEKGVDPSNIELEHHLIDGKENIFFDWEVTEDYVRKLANHLNLKLSWSWKVGGYKREMLRDNDFTAPTKWIDFRGKTGSSGGNTTNEKFRNTRLKFPQVTANLNQRWCSAYLKIDVAASRLRNTKFYRGKKVLTISGERSEESAARAKYEMFEKDRTDLRDGKRYQRHVDRYRIVHDWKEKKIWDIIERWGINPHPAYYLGFGRVSCKTCIFISDDMWSTINLIDPKRIDVIDGYEKEFDLTIHRTKSVIERVNSGSSFDVDQNMVDIALSNKYTLPIYVGDEWKLPQGAFGDLSGSL